MGLALLFSGQGTQHARMLPWLEGDPAAAGVLALMAQIIGADWRERTHDIGWATSNRIAQPLLIGVELAAWSCLAPRLPKPVAVAGYSVGELAAFAAAGVFDARAALRLANVRATAMDEAAGAQPGVMLAVRDLPLEEIALWCERHGLAIAIRLAPDRAIVGGPSHALAAAGADAAVAHARIDRIGVQVASHTPWMSSAADAFAGHLAQVPLRPATSPIVCNLTGAASSRPQELARCLSRQIASPVLWDTCLESLAERGVRCVLEVGPGTSLAAMWRERRPYIAVRSVDEFRSAEAAVDWVVRTLDRAQ